MKVNQHMALINTIASVLFQAFRTKSGGSHVALRKRNSDAESARELFKCSKDLASHVVCNEKQFLVGGCGFFVSDFLCRGLLGHLDPLYLALGLNC